MQPLIACADFIIYWSVIFIPFSAAVSPAPMNVFMGLLIVFSLIKALAERKGIFGKTPVTVPLFFLIGITALSVVNSTNLEESFKGGVLRLLQYTMVMFAVSSGIKDRRHIKLVITSAVAGLLFVFCDESWQVLVGRDFVRGYSAVANIGLIRATASFKDPNTLGIYLSAFAPLVFGLALYYFRGKKRIAMFIIGFISLAAIALTYSRPTLLAAYVALFFLGVVRKNRGLIIFMLVFTLISPFLVPKPVKDWAKAVDYNPLRFMCNDDRIAVYRNSINMIKAHPFIGVGANSFMSSYKKYKEFPEYRNVITLDQMKAHNNFLHMAGEIGLAGLALFFWFLYKLFRASADIYRKLKDNYLKIISLSVSACIIAFLFNGFTESSLYYSRVALLFWYLAGLSLSLGEVVH